MGMAVYWLGCVRAGRNLHERLVKSVLNSTSRWLDQTPVGRIIARFSKDFRATDGVIPMLFSNFTQVTFILLIKGISVIVILPLFSIPALVLGECRC
jgi:ABC-type multidrug transport system fused ATPase/permease subunit